MYSCLAVLIDMCMSEKDIIFDIFLRVLLFYTDNHVVDCGTEHDQVHGLPGISTPVAR